MTRAAAGTSCPPLSVHLRPSYVSAATHGRNARYGSPLVDGEACRRPVRSYVARPVAPLVVCVKVLSRLAISMREGRREYTRRLGRAAAPPAHTPAAADRGQGRWCLVTCAAHARTPPLDVDARCQYDPLEFLLHCHRTLQSCSVGYGLCGAQPDSRKLLLLPDASAPWPPPSPAPGSRPLPLPFGAAAGGLLFHDPAVRLPYTAALSYCSASSYMGLAWSLAAVEDVLAVTASRELREATVAMLAGGARVAGGARGGMEQGTGFLHIKPAQRRAGEGVAPLAFSSWKRQTGKPKADATSKTSHDFICMVHDTWAV